jgi:hypothetical protein
MGELIKLTYRVLVLITLLAAVAACASWSFRLTGIGAEYYSPPSSSSSEEIGTGQE